MQQYPHFYQFTNNFINTKNTKIIAFNNITKKFGLLSYIVLIIFILIVSSSTLPEYTSSSLAGLPLEPNKLV